MLEDVRKRKLELAKMNDLESVATRGHMLQNTTVTEHDEGIHAGAGITCSQLTKQGANMSLILLQRIVQRVLSVLVQVKYPTFLLQVTGNFTGYVLGFENVDAGFVEQNSIDFGVACMRRDVHILQ